MTKQSKNATKPLDCITFCRGKTNEITEILRLLKKLDIENGVITIDAIGCQKQIAKPIVEQKGHYCLAVKKIRRFCMMKLKNILFMPKKKNRKN